MYASIGVGCGCMCEERIGMMCLGWMWVVGLGWADCGGGGSEGRVPRKRKRNDVAVADKGFGIRVGDSQVVR